MKDIMLDEGRYWIEVGRASSTLDIQGWLEHLVEKTWFNEKELDSFVMQVASLCDEEPTLAASSFRHHYLEKKKLINLREKEFDRRIRLMHGGKRPMFLTISEMTKVFEEIERDWRANDSTT